MDFRYDSLIDEDVVDDCERIKSLTKKSWLNTATVSLAHLEKVKTNVYNFGITDPRDLKGTNLHSRKEKENSSPEKGTISQRSEQRQDGSLLAITSSPTNTVRAWGSNHSIPELLSQYNSQTLPKPTRPASAKYSNGRIRPPSGRKPRPQSAKEPLPDEHSCEQVFGVKGAKYDPSGRPPKGVPNGSGIGWVGPPAGLKYPDRPPDGKPWSMEFPLGDDERAESECHSGVASSHFNYEVPPPPNATPIPPSPEPEEKTKRVFELYIGDPYKTTGEDDEMLESSSDEEMYIPTSPVHCSDPFTNQVQDHAQGTPFSNGLTNEKESLRLSLPTADDDYDVADEMDTERLLAEAESVSKQFDLKNIIQANKHIPIPSAHDDSSSSFESANHSEGFENGDELSNKERAEDLVSKIITENGLKFNETNDFHKNRETPVQHVKTGVKFNEDVKTVNITPRNIGRKVEELHQNRKKSVHHNNDNFVDLIEIKNRIEPVLSTGKAGISQRENLSPKSKSSTRPPSGKSAASNATKPPLKPTSNIAKRTGSQLSDSTAKQNSFVQEKNVTQSSRPRSASAPLNRAPKPITMVTVDYNEIGAKENEKRNGEMSKNKTKKMKDEVVTMMQKMAMDEEGGIYSSHKEPRSRDQGQSYANDTDQNHLESDFNEMFSELITAPTVYKSDPEKNYYEISRHSSLSNHSNAIIKEETNKQVKKEECISRENSVIKTTKTIEFDELQPKEVTVKSVIDPLMVSTKEKEKFLVAPSPDLKSRRPPSRPSSAKPPVSKKPVTEADERPGSRLGFVAMAPDNSPREATESKRKRPSSAPSNRRPSSVLKDKENKIKQKTDKNPKETDKTQKDMTEKEKVERDKVIDNLLERTRTLVDGENSKEESPSNTEPTNKTSEKKKPRPHSAHVGTAFRCKGHSHSSKTTINTRPASATAANNKHYASYSRAGTAGSRPRKPSSGKQRIILTEPCIINTNTPYFEEETEEDLACQEMEKELADKGLNITAATLQRALYPPSGKSKYYQITAELPKKPSLALLSHPKVWLPVEYKRLQKAEKSLTRANEIMFLQEKAEKRRAYLASLTPEEKKKLKKKGKKIGKKLRRSKSTL